MASEWAYDSVDEILIKRKFELSSFYRNNRKLKQRWRRRQQERQKKLIGLD